MSERLEEAEGGAESQFNINRNRDAELMKLRKLLDDIHLESEESAHLLKKKHQEIVNDFQEQVDILTKTKSRWVLFRSLFVIQSEVWLSKCKFDNKQKNVRWNGNNLKASNSGKVWILAFESKWRWD